MYLPRTPDNGIQPACSNRLFIQILNTEQYDVYLKYAIVPNRYTNGVLENQEPQAVIY